MSYTLNVCSVACQRHLKIKKQKQKRSWGVVLRALNFHILSGKIHGEKATGSSPVCLGLSWEAPAAGCVTSDKIDCISARARLSSLGRGCTRELELVRFLPALKDICSGLRRPVGKYLSLRGQVQVIPSFGSWSPAPFFGHTPRRWAEDAGSALACRV